MCPAILRIRKLQRHVEGQRFFLCSTRKLFSKCMLYTSSIYPSFKAIVCVQGFIILPDIFQFLERCLERHMFFNKLPKLVNVYKRDIFCIDSMPNASLNQIDRIRTDRFIRDNPTAINPFFSAGNGIDVRFAETLPNLVLYISGGVGLTRNSGCLHDKRQIFAAV